jgi:hypothetical protein
MPLWWQRIDNPNETGHASTVVLDDSELEPLQDGDPGLGKEAEKRLPKPSARHLPA